MSREAAGRDHTIELAGGGLALPGRFRSRARRAGALVLAAWLVAACSAATITTPTSPGSTPPATGDLPGGTPAATGGPDGDPGMVLAAGAGPWLMPASQLDTASIAWLATDPPDPPPTPEPSPTPTPLPTQKPSSGLPANAWRVPVLMYHLVTAPVPADALAGLVVSPALFDAQMHALKDAGWSTITVAQLAAALATGQRPLAHTMAVTFDDGHVDGWTQAVPILQRYGFVGTFYVITDRFDWGEFLKSDQLVAMTRLGMEVANHTMAHLDLTALSSDKAFAQINGASDAIEGLVGVRPTTLAYPYGSVNTAVTKAAAAAGIRLALTTVDDCVVYPGNALVVPRIRVSPWNTAANLVSMLKVCTG